MQKTSVAYEEDISFGNALKWCAKIRFAEIDVYKWHKCHAIAGGQHGQNQ